ncbi:MAG: hypothetical protein ACYSXF_12150 [Planctomycetota bacterium]|jgi:hypothetical protein
MTTVKFATMLNLDVPIFGIIVSYPGTRVWELALREEGGYKKLVTTLLRPRTRRVETREVAHVFFGNLLDVTRLEPERESRGVGAALDLK